MRSSYHALALVGLLLGGLWYAGGGSTPPSFTAEPGLVSEPVTHDNLTVFFVRGPDSVAGSKVATLQEALAMGWAIVHETGDVNQLAVENRSPDTEPLHSGRRHYQGRPAGPAHRHRHAPAPQFRPSPLPGSLRRTGALDWPRPRGRNGIQFFEQVRGRLGPPLRQRHLPARRGVEECRGPAGQALPEPRRAREWRRVGEQPSTGAREPGGAGQGWRVRTRPEGRGGTGAERCWRGVRGQRQASGAEVYGSNALFQKAWPKLLNSAATEALAEKTHKPHPSAPSAKQVERFLAYGGAGSSSDISGIEPAPAENRSNHDIGFYPPARSLVIQGGISNPAAFSGRDGATRTQLLRDGGGTQPNRSLPASGLAGPINNRRNPDLRVFAGYVIAGQEERLRIPPVAVQGAAQGALGCLAVLSAEVGPGPLAVHWERARGRTSRGTIGNQPHRQSPQCEPRRGGGRVGDGIARSGTPERADPQELHQEVKPTASLIHFSPC